MARGASERKERDRNLWAVPDENGAEERKSVKKRKKHRKWW